ncbi:MAG: hypothetical protein PWQ79_1620 [Thermococcaceae archaeon]|nr:hypothetical protein [Thermococcaceae archaeon]MDK2914705.1 hypothetical protein [Thermococcaceae archaeon]
MEDTLEVLQRTYRRFFSLGTALLLLGFLTLIWRPFGREASLAIGIILFLLSFIPLEMARRIARKSLLVALRGE